MTIRLKLEIENPYYDLNAKSIGEYLKELKQTRAKIEKEDFTFENAGLCSREQIKNVIEQIDEQIKLCEHYFKTKLRKDLFVWNFTENFKPNDWDKARNHYYFSNGLCKGVIEVFHNTTSTKIYYCVKSDCDLYLYFQEKEGYKNLRSVESIKNFIEETKKSLEEEISKVEYGRDENFLDFVLNRIYGNERRSK